MIQSNVPNLIKARDINNPVQFLRQWGLSHGSATAIASGEQKHFTFQQIEVLCKAFNVTPNDLLLYVPDKKTPYTPGHPLNTIIQNNVPDVISIEKRMPPEMLRQINEFIAQLNEAKRLQNEKEQAEMEKRKKRK